MAQDNLNGSIDLFAKALRGLVKEAVEEAIQPIMEKIEKNHIDHEAWLRRIDEKVTGIDARLTSM